MGMEMTTAEDRCRGTGRTTNLILATVRRAIDNAGNPVECRDHWNTRSAHKHVYMQVSEILHILRIEHTGQADPYTITVEPRK